MKFALVILAVFCLIASAMALQSQESLRSEFRGFMNRFNRVYSSAQEMESRFQIFAANMANVEEYNKESKLAKFGVTRFSDWSPKEREAYLGKIPQDRTRQAAAAKNVVIDYTAPFPSFNFREEGTVQPVKDQGQCGSCWAFSTVFGVAAAAYKAGYTADEAFYLSQQQIVDCDGFDGGCNGGDLPSAFQYLENAGGLVSETSYPYTARDGTCKFNKADITVPVKGFEWVIPTCERSDCDRQDVAQAATNIKARGVAPSVCVYVANSWFDYDSGVYDLKCASGYNILNHCVGLDALVGQADGSIIAEIQNSWGTSWGVGGYMQILLNASAPNRCGVLDEMTFATVPKK